MLLIATRTYHDWNPTTGEEYELQDRMYRKIECGSFVLKRAGELPGDPEVETPYSLERVLEWRRECPEQIAPTVINCVVVGLKETEPVRTLKEIAMSKTTVYKVKLYDVAADRSTISRRMATADGARNMGGTIVKGSGYVVDSTELEAGEEWTATDFDPVALGYTPSKE